MDIQKAFSNNKQALDNLVETIVSSAIGDNISPPSKTDVDEAFARLEAAVQAGDKNIFRQLVAAESKNRQEDTPTLLMSAVMGDKTEIVREFVAAGVDVNERVVQIFSFDALHFAVKAEYVDIVKILLDAGAYLTHYSPLDSPLTKAIEKENLELIQILLDSGAKITFDTGYNLLVESAFKVNNPDIIQLLLDRGCDPNSTNNQADTALVNACLYGNDRAAKLLLSAGADPNKTRKDGLSPLPSRNSLAPT